MISFPQKLNAVAVSTTMRPVTQTAEVEVKRAFMMESPFPVLVAKGSMSRMVPTTITAKKLKRMVFAGYMVIPSKKRETFLNLLKIPVQIKKFRARISAGGIARKPVFPLLIIKKRLRMKKITKRSEKISE